MSEYTPNEQELIEGSTVSEDERRRAIARIKADAREALLSDEAVERAARALYETDRKEYDGDKPWPPRPHFIEDMYRERARAALTAATGDE